MNDCQTGNREPQNARRSLGSRNLAVHLVATVVPLLVAAVVFCFLPRVYVATRSLEIETEGRLAQRRGADIPVEDARENYEEIYSTKLRFWRTERALQRTVDCFRRREPQSRVSDALLTNLFCQARVTRVRDARGYEIHVSACDPSLAAGFANAYAEGGRLCVEEDNVRRCQGAERQVSEDLAKQRQEVTHFDKMVAEVRSGNDPLEVKTRTLAAIEKESAFATRVLAEKEGRLRDVRERARGGNEVVLLGPPADLPRRPVRPRPQVVFGCAGGVAVALNLLWMVLVKFSNQRKYA